MPLPDLPNLFSLLEIVLRLRDSAHVFNRNVGGGLEFDAKKINITNANKQLPYAFVVPVDKVAGRINRTECYQSRECSIGIVICVDGSKHKAQGDGTNPVETVASFIPIVAEIENVLLTWKPAGFVLDDIVHFEREHALGATADRAWIMLEYCIPYRHYHSAYGGGVMQALDAFNAAHPNFRASMIQELIVKYKAQGEFPSIVGEHFFDNIPMPQTQPTAEAIEDAKEDADIVKITNGVRAAIEDRHLGALGTEEHEQDGPFESPGIPPNFPLHP